MLKINKLISASAVDYAAEELKKYLRMMMPEGGDIEIAYDPEATGEYKRMTSYMFSKVCELYQNADGQDIGNQTDERRQRENEADG